MKEGVSIANAEEVKKKYDDAMKIIDILHDNNVNPNDFINAVPMVIAISLMDGRTGKLKVTRLTEVMGTIVWNYVHDAEHVLSILVQSGKMDMSDVL